MSCTHAHTDRQAEGTGFSEGTTLLIIMVVTVVQYVVYTPTYCCALVTSVCILDERAAQVQYVHGGSTVHGMHLLYVVWAYSLRSDRAKSRLRLHTSMVLLGIYSTLSTTTVLRVVYYVRTRTSVRVRVLYEYVRTAYSSTVRSSDTEVFITLARSVLLRSSIFMLFSNRSSGAGRRVEPPSPICLLLLHGKTTLTLT